MKITAVFLLVLAFSCNNRKEAGEATEHAAPKPDSMITANTETAVNPYAGVDVSPMDMSYYPVDYPKSKMGNPTASPPLARVIYSRPHLQGRHIFHEVLSYGQPWRLGANEATELQLYTGATIQDKKIKAGRYTLYAIPDTSNWTIILNSNIDTWGLQPDHTKDIARFTVPVAKKSYSLEYFSIVFQKTTNAVELLMAWDSVEVRLPISF